MGSAILACAAQLPCIMVPCPMTKFAMNQNHGSTIHAGPIPKAPVVWVPLDARLFLYRHFLLVRRSCSSRSSHFDDILNGPATISDYHISSFLQGREICSRALRQKSLDPKANATELVPHSGQHYCELSHGVLKPASDIWKVSAICFVML